jgi:serine/tyrosine/threonine adenylyltransferase
MLNPAPHWEALAFNNQFGQLPACFYTKLAPQGVAPQPYVVHANPQGALLLGLSEQAFNHPQFASVFSGNSPLVGGDPLAMVYSGHQFGVWAGQLGDGRALLLAQVDAPDGQRWDIQLKGGGETPYSRRGDGRAVLRSCIREYLCSEAMHALGIPTTRALAIVGTGDLVERETLEPGAVLTRLSPSHIRFGQFEHFYAVQNTPALQQLANYAIAQQCPTASVGDWFASVVAKTAGLLAQWQAVGFAHGVMNTDNMSVQGLTLDYGPFGFMEAYDPAFVCNHSDHQGRYAFNQQPDVAFWNLYRLAIALQPLLAPEDSKPILEGYPALFSQAYHALMMQKLGLFSPPNDPIDPTDSLLLQDLLSLLQAHRVDYTLCFSLLRDVEPDTLPNSPTNTPWLALFTTAQATTQAEAWLARYSERCQAQGNPSQRQDLMQRANPRYVLRNWVAETAIRAAEDHHDYSVLDQVFTMLSNPYDYQPGCEAFTQPAPPAMQHLCVSCSS